MIDLLRARDGEALGQLLRRHVLGRRAEIAATFGQPGGQPCGSAG
jgi:DNA-binding GntR family transcriptional regulator